MSELINNLQQIYNAKLAIKSAIGTQSDELADYASYINALKPDGYTYINENGDFNVSSYEYAYINVPTGGGSGVPESIWLATEDLSPIFNDPKSYEFPLHVDSVQLFISSEFNVIRDNDQNITSVEFMADHGITDGQVSIKVIVNDNVDGELEYAEGLEEAIDEYANNIYGEIRPILTDCTLSVGDGKNEDYILEGKIYAWNLGDNALGIEEITANGFYLNTQEVVGLNINVEGGGSEPESYTLVGGLFINGQGQYYIGDESAPANYINIIPKEDVTGTWSDKFSYLVVGKNTTITGYNYYNGDAFAIQAESYTQSSSLLTYHTARLANIEPYLDKEYYGLGQYYDSAYITVNRSFSNPNGTKLGISREVYGYYFPNSSYTNRYKDLMVDVSYITPVGDDIIGGQATAMAFDNTTYALDLRNIRYCEDYMVYSSTYVTSTVGIDGGIIYYEIDLTQSGNYDDSNLEISFILSGGAFFAEIPNNIGQNAEPLTVKLEIPNGTFVFDEADWVFLSNNEEMTTGSVVFNEDHNNNTVLQIDTSGAWAMDEFGNWNPTGVGELTVNGINSLKIRFYVDSSDNTWQYDWLIDVDYEWTPDGEEPEPEE